MSLRPNEPTWTCYLTTRCGATQTLTRHGELAATPFLSIHIEPKPTHVAPDVRPFTRRLGDVDPERERVFEMMSSNPDTGEAWYEEKGATQYRAGGDQ